MDKRYFLNLDIREQKLFVVFPDGSTKNGMDKQEAIRSAEELGLDLVKISDNNGRGLPICKIQDFGKIRYLESKKKKNIHHEKTKKMIIGYNISDNDLKTKINKINTFISKKQKVEVAMDCKKARSIPTNERIEHFAELLNGLDLNTKCSSMSARGRFVFVTIVPLL